MGTSWKTWLLLVVVLDEVANSTMLVPVHVRYARKRVHVERPCARM
jgi:hypothetical protein